MNKIFLGLGSNVGDKKKNILDTIELLSQQIINIQSARYYLSKAVGYPDQEDFLNTVVLGETTLNHEELLIYVKSIEKKIGRIKRFRWGPREIDVDILFYNRDVLKTVKLEIPHPRLHERDFVLIPLIDLDQDFIHPRYNKTLTQLLDEIPFNERSIKAYSS